MSYTKAIHVAYMAGWYGGTAGDSPREPRAYNGAYWTDYLRGLSDGKAAQQTAVTMEFARLRRQTMEILPVLQCTQCETVKKEPLVESEAARVICGIGNHDWQVEDMARVEEESDKS